MKLDKDKYCTLCLYAESEKIKEFTDIVNNAVDINGGGKVEWERWK